MQRGSLVIAMIIIAAPGAVLAPVWRLGGLGANEDDILYYYPSRVFFHESIRAGYLPFINPYTGLGRPFMADPQSAVWYPPTWLFAAIDPAWAYPASLWLHYSLAMWFMYRLLRSMRLRRPAALFGAIAFAFCGFMLAHRAHFAMQNAAAWTPAVLWRLRRYVDKGGAGPLFKAAAAAAMQALAGHTQIAALTALGSIVFIAAISRTSWRVCRRWLAVWLAAGGLFAIQLLPTLLYVQICTRTGNNYWDFTQNSWHPASLITLIQPMLLGQRTPNFFDQPWWGPSHQCEQFAYAGILPLLLAALAVRCDSRGEPRRRAFLLLGAFALLLALGKYGPICPLLYWFPGASLFRVPARAMVLFNLAVAGLAAFALDDLLSPLSPDRARLRAIAQAWSRRALVLWPAAMLIPIALVGISYVFMDDATRAAARAALVLSNPAIWIAAITTALSLIAIPRLSKHHASTLRGWPLHVLLLLDLAVVGWTMDVPTAITREQLVTPPHEFEYLQSMLYDVRRLWVVADSEGVYGSPLERLAANTNVLLHVRSLTDYGPLQPRHYQERFGFSPWGAMENPNSLLSDTKWAALANTTFIILFAQFTKLTPSQFDGPYPLSSGSVFYDGRFCSPPPSEAFVEAGSELRGAEAHEEAPHRITIEAGGAGERRLVLSRLWLPGWHATFLGRELPVERAYDVFLAVSLPPEAYAQRVFVEWAYYPPGFTVGALISIATLAALTCACVYSALMRD